MGYNSVEDKIKEGKMKVKIRKGRRRLRELEKLVENNRKTDFKLSLVMLIIGGHLSGNEKVELKINDLIGLLLKNYGGHNTPSRREK